MEQEKMNVVFEYAFVVGTYFFHILLVNGTHISNVRAMIGNIRRKYFSGEYILRFESRYQIFHLIFRSCDRTITLAVTANDFNGGRTPLL